MSGLLTRLQGGDRRSIGRSDEIVAEVLAQPSRFEELFAGLLDADPIVRMRAADAVEKITAKRPDWLKPHKRQLLGSVATIDQQEVRWHVAQMLPRLELTQRERRRATDILLGYLNDQSSICRTFALQALADLSEGDVRLRAKVIGLLKEAARSGTPAMKSRAKKLLKSLDA